MVEFILDAANIQPDYSLYIPLMISLSLRLLWIWKFEYLLFDTLQTSSECHIKAKNLSIQMKKRVNICPHLLWIVKFIRRKENPGDDPVHLFPHFT